MIESNEPIFEKASYKDIGLSEYSNNPLISALPEILSVEAVVRMLTKKPIFNDDEVSMPGHIRIHAINRLTRNFFVPQSVHIVLEQKISQLIRGSYLGRNPQHAIFKRKLNTVRNLIQTEDLTSYINEVVNSQASSMAISGISGAGKSTAVNIILDSYPRVIYHEDYHLLQIPWIKVDCPYDGSLSEFCESFFIALDRRLNTNYRKKYASGRPTIGKMIADVADLCLIHAIGLVVVDEFQHMNLAKSGGEKKMINFLVTLVNVVEVSVILIGTPKALKLFSSEFRQARRASAGGSIVWDRMPFDSSYESFLDELWSYQWLKSPKKRDELITNKLYELSQGVPDIAVKLFCIAQARAILLAEGSEDEYLSVDLLTDIFEEEFSIVRPMLEALKGNNPRLIEQCSDLVIPKIENALVNTFAHLKNQPQEVKKVEMGEAEETGVANAAIETLLAMGLEEDIVTPLITDTITHNPKLSLIQIIQQVTTVLSGIDEKPAPKKGEPKTSQANWSQLSDNDFRKFHADKTTTMYETLVEQGHIYPLKELLAS